MAVIKIYTQQVRLSAAQSIPANVITNILSMSLFAGSFLVWTSVLVQTPNNVAAGVFSVASQVTAKAGTAVNACAGRQDSYGPLNTAIEIAVFATDKIILPTAGTIVLGVQTSFAGTGRVLSQTFPTTTVTMISVMQVA